MGYFSYDSSRTKLRITWYLPLLNEWKSVMKTCEKNSTLRKAGTRYPVQDRTFTANKRRNTTRFTWKFEVKLWISDCVCILGKLNASSHWSNLEVWRRCVHNHGYWNELFQPSRRDTSGGKIVTRVFASTASDGLTFNADILQQHNIDKHFYL